MRICVFDLSSLYWRFANGSAGRELHGAFERTLGRVHELASGFDRVVHCCDAGTSWRTAIDPAYKAKRPPKEPSLVEQYRRTQEALAAQGHVVYVGREHPEHPGLYLEADDEIAAVVALATERGHQVQVVTGDKDLLALVDDERGVWCLNPEKGMQCNADGAYKAMGVYPGRVTDLLALGGDASDGFKPFPGVGAETALKLVQAYGDAPKALIAILSGASPLAKLTAPQLAALKTGGINALDRGFALARLLVVPGLDFGLVEAEPVKQEAPSATAQQALPIAPVHLPIQETRPSPIPQAPPSPPRVTAPAQVISEASWEEPPRQEQPRASSPLARRVAPTDFALELEPRSPDDAFAMADTLAKAGLFAFKRSEQVFAAILLARSFGLPAITLLQSVYVVDGKISLPASLIVGLVLKSGKADIWKLVESTGDRCTIKTHRRDDTDPEPVVFTYTAEDAQVAGLLGKDNWRKYRRAMLRHRCEVDLARAVYPDVVCNLYTPEELGADVDA